MVPQKSALADRKKNFGSLDDDEGFDCLQGIVPFGAAAYKGGKKEKIEKTSIKLIANVLLLFAG